MTTVGELRDALEFLEDDTEILIDSSELYKVVSVYVDFVFPEKVALFIEDEQKANDE